MNRDILDSGHSIKSSDQGDVESRGKISQLLDIWNVEQTNISDNQPLDFYVHDQQGEVVGGLVGRTSLGVFFVSYFFLPKELRRQGLGSTLLKWAEKKATLRGCHTAVLFTMAIQAPDFYLKHGYSIFGEVSSLPDGNARIFMQKRL
ncbi:GNAT family N-acetyltransferase [Photorhabdus namnaonensis]|uniref:Acetyltransferase (GNAT) family protein n=1 Tax=Photorhabdus namnaonensis TaxID=1851568 RepID=A0A1B8YCM2_9GAMM|nr:GNAT family N-acetyltransferase [Photorhabdus namnaonensis]OCA52876.1 Acetyltransferase (GNAT) family protein [Photorhabdus namnaonensis]